VKATKEVRMLRSWCSRALVALALLATPLFLFGDRALAIQDSEDKVWFGPVGLATGQRALVNIYAIGNPNEVGNPNETPWNFVVRLFDRRGVLLQERALRLAAGVTGSVELAVEDPDFNIAVPANRRTTFRAEIVGFNPQPDPPGKWTATLEVVERITGRTTLLLGVPDTLASSRVTAPGSN
jgi:hypothetical protein